MANARRGKSAGDLLLRVIATSNASTTMNGTDHAKIFMSSTKA